VNNHQNKLNSLVADVENVKLVLDHHRKYLTDNLPAEAEVEAPAETEAPKA
jgi:hypothetical protein